MIKIELDTVIDRKYIGFRSFIVHRLGIYLVLDDLRHPVYPFGIGITRQPLSLIGKVIETAVPVLELVRELSDNFLMRPLPVGYMVFLPHLLDDFQNPSGGKVEKFTRHVLYPKLCFRAQAFRYVGQHGILVVRLFDKLFQGLAVVLHALGDNRLEPLEAGHHHHGRQHQEECGGHHQEPLFAYPSGYLRSLIYSYHINLFVVR